MGIVAKEPDISSAVLRIFLLSSLRTISQGWFFLGGGLIYLDVINLSSKEAAPKVHAVCKRL